RGSSAPRKATYGCSPRPAAALASAISSGDGGWKLSVSTPCGITLRRAGSAEATAVSSRAVASLGTTQRSALRSDKRVQERKNRTLTAECSTGSVKNVASCSVTTDAALPASGIV